jgi:hypothetical protein
MTTIRDIITRAHRRANITDAGEALSSEDAQNGLDELQELVFALPGMRHWTDVLATANYTAGENERIRCSSGVTVTVPTTVSSAQTVLFCCNDVELICEGYDDRAPKDGARVQVITSANVSTTYYYRADTGEWVTASGLTLAGDVPLNADMHGYLNAMLCLRLCDAQGVQAPPAVVLDAQTGATAMRARYGKRQNVAADAAILTPANWRYAL